MRHVCPQCVHISSRRGIFHYRRRLPTLRPSEVILSLRTRDYREAGRLAAALDVAFVQAARVVGSMPHSDADIRKIIRTYLSEALERDAESRWTIKGGRPLYTPAKAVDDEFNSDADSEVLSAMASAAWEALSNRDLISVQPIVAILAERFGVGKERLNQLAVGVLEAHVELYKRLQQRTVGGEFSVLIDEPSEQQTGTPAEPRPQPPNGPLLSELRIPFDDWRRKQGGPAHTIQQDQTTFSLFHEVAGDKPPREYGRGDVTAFLDHLSRLPRMHGRSPRYRNRALSEIIAAADEDNAPRLAPKTLRRHLSALSQLFAYCVDQGRLSVAGKAELVDDHNFGKSRSVASKERDEWASEELQMLFKSPVWTGSHHAFRSQPGSHVIKDGKFWLPLLALFHGCRLEEFADLYARDVRKADGVPFVNLSNEERRLKNSNAVRVVPLHPEVIRMGFLAYVARTAPNPDDPLFPDLEPRGADRRRGPNITKWFGNYRRQIKLYRPGVGMHAFRHNANTRMRDMASDFQHGRNIDHLFGHSKGTSEGSTRYDKGPGLKSLAATVALLSYPELDLSHLYVEEPEGVT